MSYLGIEEPVQEQTWAICQECRKVELVAADGELYACQDGHDPAPFLTVAAMFRTMHQIDTILKKERDPGVQKHREMLLGYMRDLNAKVQLEGPGTDGTRGAGEP